MFEIPLVCACLFLQYLEISNMCKWFAVRQISSQEVQEQAHKRSVVERAGNGIYVSLRLCLSVPVTLTSLVTQDILFSLQTGGAE